jgi:tRNA(fMet)-specific endonuclease VapC
MNEPLVLLDSNICIYLIEGLADAARRRIERFAPGEVVTSAIAYAEVMRGVDLEDRMAAANAQALFEIIPVIPFGAEAALEYRRLPFKRHSFDRLIAAHALQLRLPLATNNERDFADVPGLRIENWVRP